MCSFSYLDGDYLNVGVNYVMIRVPLTSSNINYDFFLLFYLIRLIFYDCKIEDWVRKFGLFVSCLFVIEFVFDGYFVNSLFESKLSYPSLYKVLLIVWSFYIYSSTIDDYIIVLHALIFF